MSDVLQTGSRFCFSSKIPPWPKIKVSLTSFFYVLQPRVKRRDLLFSPNAPLSKSSCATHFQSHVATLLAASLLRRRKHRKNAICLSDRAMMSLGYEVMAVSNFKGLRRTWRRMTERRLNWALPGCRKSDVVNPCLCQQDELFTVAANELELWPLTGMGPGARLSLLLPECFYGFMEEEWAEGKMLTSTNEQERICWYRNGFHTLFQCMEQRLKLSENRTPVISLQQSNDLSGNMSL